MNREVRNISLNTMEIHPTVQRERRMYWVEELSEDYDPLGLGVFTAFENDGIIKIIDGAHRYTMLMGKGLGDMYVDVLVYTDLTISEQARVFKLLNTSKAVAPLDLYNIGLIEGNSVDVEITKLVNAFEFKIGPRGDAETIACVSQLKMMYKKDIHALRYALSKAKDLYPNDPDATSNVILRGLWELYRKHGDILDTVKAKRKVTNAWTTARLLTDRCTVMKRGNKTMYHAFVDTISLEIL